MYVFRNYISSTDSKTTQPWLFDIEDVYCLHKFLRFTAVERVLGSTSRVDLMLFNIFLFRVRTTDLRI